MKGKIIDFAGYLDKYKRKLVYTKPNRNVLKTIEKEFLQGKYDYLGCNSHVVCKVDDKINVNVHLVANICSNGNKKLENCGNIHINFDDEYIDKVRQVVYRKHKIFLKDNVKALEEYKVHLKRYVPLRLAKDILSTYSFPKIAEKIYLTNRWGHIQWVSIPFKKSSQYLKKESD